MIFLATSRPSPGGSISSRCCATSSARSRTARASATARRVREEFVHARPGSLHGLSGFEPRANSNARRQAAEACSSSFSAFSDRKVRCRCRLTEEAYHCLLAQDDAFPRFLDIFNHRFLQLFFRAWADSRPIAQHDRPATIASSPMSARRSVWARRPIRISTAFRMPRKLGFAGLLGAQAKSASRLAGSICGIVQRQGGSRGIRRHAASCSSRRSGPARLALSRLGERRARRAAASFSVQDKIRVRIFTKILAQYIRFLPTGDLCEPLADLVFFYIGDQLDWDLELAIPAGAAAARQARNVRPAGLDDLDGAELGSDGSISARRPLSSGGAHAAQRKRRTATRMTEEGDDDG